MLLEKASQQGGASSHKYKGAATNEGGRVGGSEVSKGAFSIVDKEGGAGGAGSAGCHTGIVVAVGGARDAHNENCTDGAEAGEGDIDDNGGNAASNESITADGSDGNWEVVPTGPTLCDSTSASESANGSARAEGEVAGKGGEHICDETELFSNDRVDGR